MSKSQFKQYTRRIRNPTQIEIRNNIDKIDIGTQTLLNICQTRLNEINKVRNSSQLSDDTDDLKDLVM